MVTAMHNKQHRHPGRHLTRFLPFSRTSQSYPGQVDAQLARFCYEDILIHVHARNRLQHFPARRLSHRLLVGPGRERVDYRHYSLGRVNTRSQRHTAFCGHCCSLSIKRFGSDCQCKSVECPACATKPTSTGTRYKQSRSCREQTASAWNLWIR